MFWIVARVLCNFWQILGGFWAVARQMLECCDAVAMAFCQVAWWLQGYCFVLAQVFLVCSGVLVSVFWAVDRVFWVVAMVF